MNNKHIQYKNNNNKRLITTASIALVLFNVQPAKADDNDEFEEINDIKQKQEEVVTNPQETEEKTDDEISIDSEEIIEYKVSGEKLQVVDIPTGYTHSIVNIGENDLVTVMWVNECFDPNKPDTYYLEV